MSESQEFKIVDELRPGLRGINIKVRCNSKNEVREIVSRKTGETLRVTEALVGDETGSILLTLWNEDIDKMEPDNVYQLNNSYTTVFKGSLRLNLGKYGSMEKIKESTPAEVNTANNLSDKVYEQERRFRPRYGDRPGGYGGGGKPYRGERRGYRDRGPGRR
ncbi:MAG: single-stranded DNA-binding protein [Candidatus Jordarchaeum sp.]|uniref:single-stranded DNA-binding protein n=1 Tax=Candidatus Jordarchaeum sp. TaxID=2823881 RepID=UPI00404932F1